MAPIQWEEPQLPFTDEEVPAEESPETHIAPQPPSATATSQAPLSDEVAMAGSPNTSTDISFDVRSEHLRTPLLGTLVRLDVPVHAQNGPEDLLVLGQVSKLVTENRWHEDPSLKNYIKLRGRLPHLTEIGDITTGSLQIIGAYRTISSDHGNQYQKVRLPVPPGSGLPIKAVDASLIQAIMANDFGYAYLGAFYGSASVPAPVYVRHFGDFSQNGSGEAYMGGVFGPSGSGKSVIAAALMALWSHSPQMGLLLLDPQGEFSANSLAQGTGYSFDFHSILSQLSGGRFNPTDHVVPLSHLQLEGTEMFVQVLVEKDFFKRLGVSDGKVSEAAERIALFLEGIRGQAASDWHPTKDWATVNALQPTLPGQQSQPFSTLFAREVASAYAASGRQAKIAEFQQEWQNQSAALASIWNETAPLFRQQMPNGQPRVNANQLIEQTVMHGAIRILNLDPQTINMSQRFKLYLMDFIFRRLRQVSHISQSSNTLGNCLIVLDEAGRFIPQDPGEDQMLRSLCKRLTDSVKEMRKLRCGFMFITQTIAEIQKEIYRQLHFRVYGVGLGVGADADHIKSREGDEAYDLYRSLPDPRLSGTFSYMVAGVLLALGSSGRPMVIEGFPSGQAILAANSHILTANQQPSLDGLGTVVS